MESVPFIRRLIFPAPQPPTYEYDSFPSSTIWVPALPLSPIPCIFLPYRGGDALLIFAHGNGCDIGSMYDTLSFYKNHWKVNILLVEYPGYGACLGTPSEAGINVAVYAVYDFITNVLNWPTDRQIWYGQSIGTGPVCALAAKLNAAGTQLGGIVLQSPFTSMTAVVKGIVGTNIAGGLIKTTFDNLKCMQSITSPILIIHGAMDTLIPLEHSQSLLNACASNRKHLLSVNSATHNVFDHQNDIIEPVAQFLQCYLRTPMRQLSEKEKAEKARIARVAEARANAAPSDLSSSLSSSSPTDQASSSSSSSSSSPSASSSSDDESNSILPYLHSPPSSPLPPPTIKLPRQYFTVPPDVLLAHQRLIESQVAAADSSVRSAARKASIKGFFSNIGAKFTAASNVMSGTNAAALADDGRGRSRSNPATVQRMLTPTSASNASSSSSSSSRATVSSPPVHQTMSSPDASPTSPSSASSSSSSSSSRSLPISVNADAPPQPQARVMTTSASSPSNLSAAPVIAAL